jgi:hypothetical protein
VTLAILVALGQVADGLAYQLARGHGVEANPGMAGLDPGLILAIKLAGGLVLAIGSFALVRRNRTRLVSWIAVVGFVGALTEAAAL